MNIYNNKNSRYARIRKFFRSYLVISDEWVFFFFASRMTRQRRFCGLCEKKKERKITYERNPPGSKPSISLLALLALFALYRSVTKSRSYLKNKRRRKNNTVYVVVVVVLWYVHVSYATKPYVKKSTSSNWFRLFALPARKESKKRSKPRAWESGV